MQAECAHEQFAANGVEKWVFSTKLHRKHLNCYNFSVFKRDAHQANGGSGTVFQAFCTETTRTQPVHVKISGKFCGGLRLQDLSACLKTHFLKAPMTGVSSSSRLRVPAPPCASCKYTPKKSHAISIFLLLFIFYFLLVRTRFMFIFLFFL